MTAEDLKLEQEYLREKQKRHNRYLHGFGVVFGLEVSVTGDQGGNVHVTPGLAFDCEGNEVVVGEPLTRSLPWPEEVGSTIFLSVVYLEKETDVAPEQESGFSEIQYLRIEERFTAVFEKENSNQRHRHLKGRWQTCGTPHPLTIAKLRHAAGRWRIDRRHHRPFVK